MSCFRMPEKKTSELINAEFSPIDLLMGEGINPFQITGSAFALRGKDPGQKGSGAECKSDPLAGEGLKHTGGVTAEKDAVTGHGMGARTADGSDAAPGSRGADLVMVFSLLPKLPHSSWVGNKAKIGQTLPKVGQSSVSVTIKVHFQCPVVTDGVGEMGLKPDPIIPQVRREHSEMTGH